MNRLFAYCAILILFVCSSKAQKSEQSYVFDYEHVLTESEERVLDSIYRLHDSKTTNQIALVTTPDYGGQPNMMLYAVEFGNDLGVGQADKDNGVVIAFSKSLRKTFIATGYGTEEVLKDKIVKSFVDSIMIPNFKHDRYFEGLLAGSQAIIEFLERPENEIK